DKSRAENRAKTNALLQKVLLTDTSENWIARLNKAGVPSGPVYSMDQVFADPQVKHLGLAWTVQHPTLGPIDLVRSPMNLAGVEPPRRPTPERGEHTAEVLAEFGVSAEELERLRAAGAV
ncbi:MAG: CoA transferase, partial [Acetobacteraceae bacterium]|nr:CoA transferase [Acetobacteraceae bacterium]